MTGHDMYPGMSPDPRRLVAVDPPGCGCTGCMTSESVPLDRASDAQIAELLTGTLDNCTGLILAIDPAIRVIPLYAENSPVEGHAPDEYAWRRIEHGWHLDARLFRPRHPIAFAARNGVMTR